MHLIQIVFLMLLTSNATAEIITDGSLGAKLELSGKDFQITPELGQQFGGNLFHSFQQFNLSEGESATFSGANTVQNIIARVTGGQPSTIDGILRSTIPNADLYFLNPYGILFGKNAKLDLQGGFHASTADYLKLQDGGRFEARQLNNSLLTVAPVTSFGFLTHSPAPLTIENSELSVPNAQTLSLIGGDLSITGESKLDAQSQLLSKTFDHPLFPLRIPLYTAQLTAPAGRINLVSVASPGEIIPTANELNLNASGGSLTLNRSNVVGNQGGRIFLRTGQLQLFDTHLESQNLATQSSGLIDIQTQQLTMRGVDNYSSIQANSWGEQPAGMIKIQADQIDLSNGAEITASSFSSGSVGNVMIRVTDALNFAGKFITNNNKPSGIAANAYSVEDNSQIQRNQTGHINIEAGQLILTQGAGIATTTYGTNDAADIYLKVHGTLTLSDYLKVLNVPGVRGYNSALASLSLVGSAFLTQRGIQLTQSGKSGNIQVEAQQFNLLNDAVVSNSTFVGDAGDIEISVNQLNLQDRGGIYSVTGGTGRGGNIHIQATEKVVISNVREGGFVQPAGRISALSWGNVEHAGDSGDIMIQSPQIHLYGQNSLITTSTVNATGGDITLETPEMLYLQAGEITTSVSGGLGDGGNIMIENVNFAILNQGQIKAQADAGQGGNIHIAAQHFVPSVDSLINASSNLGIDGQITIDSPTEDVGNQVLNLSANFLNAAALFPRSCAARIADQRPSQFVRPFTLAVKSRTIGIEPEDLHPSHLQPH